jgi:hypothetical protein
MEEEALLQYNDEIAEKQKDIANILLLADVELATSMLDADDDTDASINYEALAWLVREEGSLYTTITDESLMQLFPGSCVVSFHVCP